MASLMHFLKRFLTLEASATPFPSAPEMPASQNLGRNAQSEDHTVSFDDLLRAMGADL
ncbi:hypothetical protein [Deinococcus alpinitundrae]|uniref:hypothetical protein n=1 Tax=Deinococcus alpinitundrae TaxID=468913 RepID=UPI00137B56DD|nr:hypothetical protein [Deinococcus alpinitundrae]